MSCEFRRGFRFLEKAQPALKRGCFSGGVSRYLTDAAASLGLEGGADLGGLYRLRLRLLKFAIQIHVHCPRSYSTGTRSYYIFTDQATCKMPSDEAEWSSKIYNEACCYNHHLRHRFGLGEIPSHHHHALFASDLGPCNHQIHPCKRSG